jgi:hypothetical protein
MICAVTSGAALDKRALVTREHQEKTSFSARIASDTRMSLQV